MFCVSYIFGNVINIMFRSLKFGLALLMSFSLINGMENVENEGRNVVAKMTYKCYEGVDRVRIFGDMFVAKNKNKFKIVVNDG